jgi:biopolymer transport protein TolR
MGAAIGNNKKSSSRRKRRVISDINVTPMVDVMLVLLIIFMVTSPMLVTGVDVDLPQADASAISGSFDPLTVSIKKNGSLYLMETEVANDSLIEKLNAASKENKEIRIFVKCDKDVPYGSVVQVMANIRSAGFTKVSLVSDSKNK